MLNPVLTFLSFTALLFTIILQQREIHGAKEDAKVLQSQRHADRLSSERMQFENTFFQMVSIHNTIVNSIDVDRGPSKNQLRGRECFQHFRDVMQSFYDADGSPDELKKSLAAHDHLWKSYQNDLAHYYRYLYNIIRFINESDVNKLRYSRILRAQLSDFELLVLFYNGLFPLAAKFKEYVEFFTVGLCLTWKALTRLRSRLSGRNERTTRQAFAAASDCYPIPLSLDYLNSYRIA